MPNRQTSENIVRIADSSGVERVSLPAGIGGLSVFAFAPDSSVLAAASYDADVRIWNTANGELLRLIEELPVAMFTMAFSPDGRYLATAGADRLLYLWDAKTWKLDRKLSGQPEMISALAFSPDGRKIVTGGFNELTTSHPVSVLLWEATSGKVIHKWAAPSRVQSVAFSGAAIEAMCGGKKITLEKPAN
jgi:WD40 repeat protein